MAVDTFVAYGGVYSDLARAEADYELVKDLHTQAAAGRCWGRWPATWWPG